MMETSYLFLNFIWIWACVLQICGKVHGEEDCQIQNIALNKTASQSSSAWDGSAEQAVDGNVDPNYFHGSCTHTEEYGPRWWRVDLGYIAKIITVNITNRLDVLFQASKRLRQFEICLSNSTVNTLDDRGNCHTQIERLGSGETKSYYFGSAGQLVIINKFDEATEALTLCEVQVYAEVCSMITTMSSAESIQSESTSFESQDVTSTEPITGLYNCEDALAASTVESGSNRPRCSCGHRANVSFPKTDEEVMAQIKTLKTELTVDKKTTNFNKRKLISATDDRTSSKTIGAVGIVVLCVPVVFIVVIDLSRCVSWWSTLRH